jgi:hypothetical protein
MLPFLAGSLELHLHLSIPSFLLQVRALEVERLSRRSGIMNAALMSSIGSMGFLNIGVMLALNHVDTVAGLALALSLTCGLLTSLSFQRVKRLDQFEKDIKG